MKLFDHVFTPWTADGDRRILADEAAWLKLREWDGRSENARLAADSHNLRFAHRPNVDVIQHVRPRVLVGGPSCDWAEDWQSTIVDSDGDVIEFDRGKLWRGVGSHSKHLRCATIGDVQLELLDLAAEFRNLDWFFLSKFPERVTGILESWRTMVMVGEGDWVPPQVPPNFNFVCPVSDQSSAESLIPNLLKIRKVAPQSKLIVLYDGSGHVQWDVINIGDTQSIDCLAGERSFAGFGGRGGHSVSCTSIDGIIIAGDVGPDARPCDIENVRSTIAQCRDAEVPVWVERLGKRPYRMTHGLKIGPHYVPPRGHDPRTPEPWPMLLLDPTGSDPSEWPEDLQQARELPK